MSVLALSLRAVLRGRRLLAVAVLPLLVGVFAVLVRARSGGADRSEAYAVLAGELLVLLTGLVGLVLGVNAFGDDRDEGTLGLLLATTLPRWRIALAKYAAAAGVTWLACLPGTLGCLALVSATSLPVGEAAAGLLLQRSLLVGLAYLVLWEGLLAGTTTAFRNLSVGAYASRVVSAPFDDPPFSTADAGVTAAAVVLVAVAALALLAAVRQLPRTRL